MRPRLLTAVLVLMLSGTNCDAASICAAYCISSASAGSAAVHHHQRESQPAATNISHHIHAYHHAADCPECPPELGNNLNQSADCAGLVQIQAIKEASFSFDAPRGVAHVDLPHTPADALVLADGGEPAALLCDTSQRIRTSDPPSAPLRI
jgi:hypothetical protein